MKEKRPAGWSGVLFFWGGTVGGVKQVVGLSVR